MQSTTTTVDQEVHKDTTTTDYPGKGKKPLPSILREPKEVRYLFGEATETRSIIHDALGEVSKKWSLFHLLGWVNWKDIDNQLLFFLRTLSFPDTPVASTPKVIDAHAKEVIREHCYQVDEATLEVISKSFCWDKKELTDFVAKCCDEEDQEFERIGRQLENKEWLHWTLEELEASDCDSFDI